MKNAAMAETLYDSDAPKKPANLSVNADLLRQAKSRKINLSRLLEQRLVEVLKETEREAWLQQNQSAIEEYNARIESSGAFSDALRRF